MPVMVLTMGNSAVMGVNGCVLAFNGHLSSPMFSFYLIWGGLLV